MLPVIFAPVVDTVIGEGVHDDGERRMGDDAPGEAAVRTLLAGLRQFDADDPRLDQYAMPE